MDQGLTTDSLILVTGARGFVGRAVTAELLRSGYRVRILVRGECGISGVEEIRGDITDPEAVSRAVKGADAVIHLAARKSDEADSDRVNIEGARLLADCCRKSGVRRIVNVSTQSARLRKPGVYGRTKLAAEKIFRESGLPVITLRPSVVYDNEGGDIVKSILTFMKLPVLPMIGDGTAHFRPIHNDDLAQIVVASLSHGTDKAPYDVGGPDAVSFRGLVDALQKRAGTKKRVFAIPAGIAMAIARITSWMPHPPITVSNVLGAAEDLPMDMEPLRRDFGITPRSLSAGLDEVFRTIGKKRRRREAVALLQYAFSAFGPWNPSDAEIERYEKAVQNYGLTDHRLPDPLIRSRWLLGACDSVSGRDAALRKKILIAAAIGECSPATADFTLPRDRPVVSIAAHGILMVLRAAAKKLMGLLLLVVFPFFIRRHAGR